MINIHRSQLHAADAAHLRSSLRAAPQTSLDVDVDAGVIRGVALMSVGEAKGHGYMINAQSLNDALASISAQPAGAMLRFKHPDVDQNGIPKDAIGTQVGVVKNARIDGDVLRGDVHFGTYSKTVPGHGDLRTYLLGLAKEQPTHFGLSAQHLYVLDPTAGGPMPAARIAEIEAIDFVDRPAANQYGLLAALPKPNPPTGTLPSGTTTGSSKGTKMNWIAYLVSLGMDPNATADQIATFYNSLPPDKQAAAMAAYPTETAQLKAAPPPAAGAGGPGGAASGSAVVATDAHAMGQNRAGANQTTTATNAGGNGTTAAPDPIAAIQVRRDSLGRIAKAYGLPDGFVNEQLATTNTIEQSIEAGRSQLAITHKPLEVNVRGDRNMDTLGEGIRDALLIRGGVKVDKPSDRSSAFKYLTLAETARAYLSAVGVATDGMTRNAICELVFNRGKLAALGRGQLMHTPGDFSNILADTINKSLRSAYDLSETTYQLWTRQTTTADFKPVSRVQLSEGPGLRRVSKGGEYPDVALSDSKEAYSLAKYGYIITVSWETLVNDDKDAFGRLPQLMGQDAKQLEDDLAYLVLLNNANMSDGNALFSSAHVNLTASGAAPNTAQLNTMVTAMTKQKGLNGRTLNLRPANILVPTEIEATTWQVLNSTSDPSSSNANVKSRFGPGGAVKLNLISTAKLSNGVSIMDEDNKVVATAAGSATAWYGTADTNQVDTVEVCKLEGEPAPVTTEQDGFRVDGRQFKIRHTVAAAAIDFRGMYKNAGA